MSKYDIFGVSRRARHSISIAISIGSLKAAGIRCTGALRQRHEKQMVLALGVVNMNEGKYQLYVQHETFDLTAMHLPA
jgi:hypothetical protein